VTRPRPTLLLTRRLAASLRFAQAFRGRFGADWPVVISPLMVTTFLAPDLPDEAPDQILFTSETAVEAFVRLTSDRRATAWCVGPRTSAMALAAGFGVREGPGDALALAAQIRAAPPGGRMLWPRGAHTAHDFETDLAQVGLPVRCVTVYRQEPVPPTREATDLVAALDPILLPLFSPRSARLASDAFAAAVAPLLVAALSPAVAEAAGPLHPQRLSVADRPDSESLLAAMAALF